MIIPKIFATILFALAGIASTMLGSYSLVEENGWRAQAIFSLSLIWFVSCIVTIGWLWGM